MLHSFQRLIARPTAPDSGLGWLDPWSHRRGELVKRVRGDAGLVIEGRFADRPVRVEWGPSQRDYVRGRELRLRYELGLPGALEMVIVSRDLAEQLEARTFDDLTRDQQTGIDTSMPEEARWIAMYERVPADRLPPGVADGFVVLSARAAMAQHWVDGELAVRLLRARTRWLSRDIPLVLMTLRGRVYLRTEAPVLEENLLEGVRQLGDAAALAARRVAERPLHEADSTMFDIDEML